MEGIPESHRDLLDGEVAALATVGPDGRPQVSAVWFLVDGDAIVLTFNDSRQKARNLRARPGCTFFALDPANPARYLELRGDAEVADDPDYAVADRVGARYGGVDMRAKDGPGIRRLAVRLRPATINAVDISDRYAPPAWAARP